MQLHVTVQHPALLQPCSLGNVQSLILPRQEFDISCAELFRIVPQCGTPSRAFCTAQGRDGFTAFPLPSWSVGGCSSISVFSFSIKLLL